MTSSLIQNGFSQTLSDMVARALTTLPSDMTHKEDSAFVRYMFMQVMDAFWHDYIAEQPEEIQQTFLTVEDAEDEEGITNWFRDHANFKDNKEHLALAERVIADIDAKLPSVIKQEYDAFTSPSAQ